MKNGTPKLELVYNCVICVIQLNSYAQVFTAVVSG